MSDYSNALYKVLEVALEIKKEYRISYIGTEELLYAILLTQKCDACKILNELGANKDNFYRRFLITLRKTSVEKYTPNATAALYRAKDVAISFKVSYISPEHLLLGILSIEDCNAVKILRALGVDISMLYSKVVNYLRATAQKPVQNASCDPQNKYSINNVKSENLNNIKPLKTNNEELDLEKEPAKKPEKNNSLNGLGYDMTYKAKLGKIDAVIGRNNEIERVIQTLSRKTKNSPLLIGEAGVGKTAVVEGLAIKIAEGKVPDFLKNKKLFSLDLASLVAGTRYRGDFENRLKSALEYAENNKGIVFFIDEIHNLVGAGSTNDSNLDAAEILKPLIARGEIMLIGATTNSEYSKFIEKDAALERRFQPIIVEEPTVDDSISILKGIRPSFEAHHKVYISDEAIISACKLSKRYIEDRFLPDKAIDLIDEASSKKRVEKTRAVDKIVELEKTIRRLNAEKDYCLSKTDLDGAKNADKEIFSLQDKIKKLKEKALDNRAETPTVTEEDIRELISLWTKIPVMNITDKDANKLLSIEEELSLRVIGQSEAIKTVAKSVKRSRANLKDPEKPIGSFLFVGPTGVGKSELSKALAESVFGSKNALIRFDMSEYSDKTSVNKLIGSAPGYVGYESEGLLTQKIRRKPYSVVLFDEIEKADPEVFDLLLQVLDEGRLTDSKGRLVSFKNSLIILTSNLGTGTNSNKSIGFGNQQDSKTAVVDAVKKHFRSEFINRLDDIIVFNSLTKNDCKIIANIAINDLINRMNDNGFKLTVDEGVVDFIVDKGYSQTYGARPIKRTVSTYIEDLLSDAIIDGKIVKGDNLKLLLKDNLVTYEKV